MARHKQLQTEEQGDPEMNISSLIDCVFLLLIYFIVATSLVSEKKLDISIPATEGQASSKPPLDPGKISVRGDGTTFWNNDLQVSEPYDASLADAKKTDPAAAAAYSAQRKMEQLVEQLKLLKDQATAIDTNPVVMLEGSPRTAHQRIVDVMAALAEADIHSVGLSTAVEE
ncbi:MAG: biopolymer transporter ExbD [Akkermansia sp.]|nr:biopolymer transporter ExbD [Akkermansia sp.]MBR1978890.1 biopolymer transporter ExbD [Akkermansia sp.]